MKEGNTARGPPKKQKKSARELVREKVLLRLCSTRNPPSAAAFVQRSALFVWLAVLEGIISAVLLHPAQNQVVCGGVCFFFLAQHMGLFGTKRGNSPSWLLPFSRVSSEQESVVSKIKRKKRKLSQERLLPRSEKHPVFCFKVPKCP